MTPGARIAAAIAILDDILDGRAAEAALTGWARGGRYAGSGDRAAVRDLVFTALRQQRSLAWLGGAQTGRGLMLGLVRSTDVDPGALFNGQGHAPSPPIAAEAGAPLEQAPESVRADLPDWLWSRFQADLGQDARPVADALRHRAPVWLRVNLARSNREAVQLSLASEGIETILSQNIKTALQVIAKERMISRSIVYLSGLVELQDAASQAAVLALPVVAGQRVLDYCAGGGGKALALAALGAVVTAHDVDPGRMIDLPARAQRACVQIDQATTSHLPRRAPFDGVLVDAPCSGSGTWRRAPDAKWRLTPQRLDELCALQRQVLAQASAHVRPGGWLGYATCSILTVENAGVVGDFIRQHPDFLIENQHVWRPGTDGDGFFLAILRRGQGGH